MRLAHKIAHLFLPRESNNHKAKILHTGSLIAITLTILLYHTTLDLVKEASPRVLGYASNISVDEVIRLTNERRKEKGLAALTHNSSLSQAATAKGQDMLKKDYWAHVSPDGVQPWAFFKNVGYRYRYAGENLARDFSNAPAAVAAWMASPSHRDNLLSAKYKEIGIGVVEGDLSGADTTIIVQFFGTRSGIAEAAPSPVAGVIEEELATPAPALAEVPNPPSETATLVSPFKLTQGVSLGVVGLLTVVLAVDSLIITRKKITRLAGRPLAHFAFLGMILAIVFIIKAGNVL